MKRIYATFTGIALATGLAVSAPRDTPLDLANRYFAATNETTRAANWRDWHPDAEHRITIKYGMGQPDDHITYAVADWETLPDWRLDPAFAEAMKGYTETTANAPKLSSETVGAATVITAKSRVNYTWGGRAGKMNRTDRFRVASHLGALVIHGLETTYDYR